MFRTASILVTALLIVAPFSADSNEEKTSATEEEKTGADAKNALAELGLLLKRYGIGPGENGVREYLQQVTDEDIDWTEAQSLIEKMESGNFLERAKAEQALTKLAAFPVDLLQEASQSPDIELAERARRILKKAGYQRMLTIYKAFQVIELLKLTGFAKETLTVAAGVREDWEALRLAKRAMSATVLPEDIPFLTSQIDSDVPAPIREMAVYGLRQLSNPELADRFERWERNDKFTAETRLAAAFALAEIGDKGPLDRRRKTAIDWIKDLEVWLPDRGPVERISLQQKTFDQAELFNLRCFPKLEYLSLGKSGVSDEGLVHLSNSTELQSLNMTGNFIDGSGLAYLANLEKLNELYLGVSVLKDEGLSHLGKLRNLEELSLGQTKVTDAGMVHLKGLTNLKYLSISETQVTDASFIHFKDLESLEHLRFSENRIEGPGVVHLTGLPKLERIQLWCADI